MKVEVKVTRRAAREIEKAADWWSTNRSKAPGAPRRDLRQAFKLLEEQPEIGTPAKNAALKGVRRLLLRRIRYYLYYRFVQDPERIEILAFWHASRGEEPEL